MSSTTFAQRTGHQPARARGGACALPVVDLGLARSAYRAGQVSWQFAAIDPLAAHGAPTANATSMSTKHCTRTLGTRTT